MISPQQTVNVTESLRAKRDSLPRDNRELASNTTDASDLQEEKQYSQIISTDPGR
jgi:hypothetical protein